MFSTQTSENLDGVEDVFGLADAKDPTSLALQSQYASSARIKALGGVFQTEIDPTREAFEIKRETNVATASGRFLDAIGKRVGIDRYVTVDGDRFALDDDRCRFLILYKASANVSNSSIKDLNNLLTYLMGVPVFVVDNQNMTIDVRLIGDPQKEEIAILKAFGLLLRGCGVGYNITIVSRAQKLFGFEGSRLMPFNQGQLFNVSNTTGNS